MNWSMIAWALGISCYWFLGKGSSCETKEGKKDGFHEVRLRLWCVYVSLTLKPLHGFVQDGVLTGEEFIRL